MPDVLGFDSSPDDRDTGKPDEDKGEQYDSGRHHPTSGNEPRMRSEWCIRDETLPEVESETVRFDSHCKKSKAA